ncbi:MAG TPA: ABC transporter ATP-binding protein [Longimicrobiales bacterium]
MSYVEIENVTKKFGGKVALDSVSLRITTPSIVGLMGKNGSGKSTLLRHICGLQLPTSGVCRTLGTDTAVLDSPELSRIGIAHQHDSLIGWMSGGRLISYVSGFYATWDTALEERLVKLLEINRDAGVATSSPGNRQKLSLLLAVCHHPTVLLLDEPLSDLDPIARRDVIDVLIEEFQGHDVAIVISSHLLHDLERIAERIVCLDAGRVVADASLDELKEQYGSNLDTMFRRIVGASA